MTWQFAMTILPPPQKDAFLSPVYFHCILKCPVSRKDTPVQNQLGNFI